MKHFTTYVWIYRPISIVGWCITLITIAFNVNVFIVINRLSQSISDTFYGIFPYCISSLTILFWIASTSLSNNK